MHIKNTKKHLTAFLFTLNLISFSFFFLITPQIAQAASCSLSYEMVATNETVQSGGLINRTIVVKNNGTGICRNVSYSLFYGDNESYVSSSVVSRSNNYYWYVGTLRGRKSVTMDLTTRHMSSSPTTEITTEGCASADTAQDSCGVSTVRVVSAGTSAPVVVPVVVPTKPVVLPPATSPLPTTPTTPVPGLTKKEQGMWVWDFPKDMNTPAAKLELKELATHGFNVLYITIDDYLDIAVLPEGPTKESLQAEYFASLSLFVKQANSLGMVVDAEGGARDWAESSKRWKGFALIDAMKEYNQAYPTAKLRGFQYDVEPYLLPTYETNKAGVLTEYVTFIDQSVTRLKGSDLKFSIAIPHFYDDAQAWTPTITYGGKTMHTYNHLLTILEKKPGSMILIMAYRNFFEGANGTREISEVEIKEAAQGNYSTDIIVAQETGNVDPAFVTFYGLTKAALFGDISKINSAFNSYSSYGGTAVHYIDSFLDLK